VADGKQCAANLFELHGFVRHVTYINLVKVRHSQDKMLQ